MNEVTAVLAAIDHLAMGILRALHERGRKVPQDISVVGFEVVPEAGHFIPPLTAVRPDFDAVAAATLDLLLAQISSGHRLGDRRMLTPSLISRDLVAPRATGFRESRGGLPARTLSPSRSRPDCLWSWHRTITAARSGRRLRGDFGERLLPVTSFRACGLAEVRDRLRAFG